MPKSPIFEKKNVLITGGAGFIGSHLAERVLREPELQRKISVIDISPYIGKVLGRLGSGQTIRQMMREEKGGDLYRMLFESKQSRDVKASSDMA